MHVVFGTPPWGCFRYSSVGLFSVLLRGVVFNTPPCGGVGFSTPPWGGFQYSSVGWVSVLLRGVVFGTPPWGCFQ